MRAFPVVRHGLHLPRLGVALAGMLLLPAVLTAQIKPLPPPLVPQPPLKIALPGAPADLVIDAVTVTDVVTPPFRTLATVTVRNAGGKDATFPAGSVLVRGDAGQSGGVAFQPLGTPQPYTIASGASVQLTLAVGDVCAAGTPGAVTFHVDPGAVVPEGNESNNALALPTVGSFSNADLQVEVVALGPQGTTGGSPGMGAQGVSAGSVGDLAVAIVNKGSGEALLCPGAVLWREVESPVSGKYGLRTVMTPAALTRIASYQSSSAPPGARSFVSRLTGAYQAGDLPPGTYTWKVTVNPNGQIRETNGGNNVKSASAVIM